MQIEVFVAVHWPVLQAKPHHKVYVQHVFFEYGISNGVTGSDYALLKSKCTYLRVVGLRLEGNLVPKIKLDQISMGILPHAHNVMYIKLGLHNRYEKRITN